MGLYTSKRKVDIAAISEVMQSVVSKWQNGVIKILDPHISGGTYNVWENKTTGRNPATIWEGPARIQPIRWPIVVTGKAEQSAYKSVRFQIPRDIEFDFNVIREGLRIEVSEGGMFEDMESMIFVITAATNSSFAWNRTIDATVDTGVDIGGL